MDKLLEVALSQLFIQLLQLLLFGLREKNKNIIRECEGLTEALGAANIQRHSKFK